MNRAGYLDGYLSKQALEIDPKLIGALLGGAGGLGGAYLFNKIRGKQRVLPYLLGGAGGAGAGLGGGALYEYWRDLVPKYAPEKEPESKFTPAEAVPEYDPRSKQKTKFTKHTKSPDSPDWLTLTPPQKKAMEDYLKRFLKHVPEDPALAKQVYEELFEITPKKDLPTVPEPWLRKTVDERKLHQPTIVTARSLVHGENPYGFRDPKKWIGWKKAPDYIFPVLAVLAYKDRDYFNKVWDTVAPGQPFPVELGRPPTI